jgi:hypothetical protein
LILISVERTIMRKLRLLIFAILPVLAFAQDTKPQAAAPTATVYVYRYKQFVGSALSPSVFCDEVELARADNGRYFTASIEPGKHSFRSNDRQSGIDLDLKPGQSYFIRVDIAAGMMKGHGRLTLMSAEQGSYELKSDKLKPLDSGKVRDQARVSVTEAHPEVQAAAVKLATPVQAAVQSQPSSTAQDQPAHIVTISDPKGAVNSGSQFGDQVSLGEAARRAKQKKDPPQG